MAKKRLNEKLQAWVRARELYRLSPAHVQMARLHDEVADGLEALTDVIPGRVDIGSGTHAQAPALEIGRPVRRIRAVKA